MNSIFKNYHSYFPKGTIILAFTQLCESFSFFGMRSLLVLYLINQFHFVETHAYSLYALYIALIEIGSMIGGYCADRIFGFRYSILLGGSFICLGHLLLTFFSKSTFFIGLGFIVCGSTLFRSNLKAYFGSLYNDSKRESGFTFLYSGMNFGGFLAALSCGFIASKYNWEMGFGLAAFGIFIGMFVFLINLKSLKHQEKTGLNILSPGFLASVFFCTAASLLLGMLLKNFSFSEQIILPISLLFFFLLSFQISKTIKKKNFLTFMGLLALLIVYFTAEQLLGSIIMVYSQNHVERILFGFEIPASVLSAINPLTIILIGPSLAIFVNRNFLSPLFSSFISYFCLTLAFALLYINSSENYHSIYILMASFALIALGELFLVPSLYAYCSEIASEHLKGLTMSCVMLSFAIANLMSGKVATLFTNDMPIDHLFLSVSIISTIVTIALYTSNFKNWFLMKRNFRDQTIKSPYLIN